MTKKILIMLMMLTCLTIGQVKRTRCIFGKIDGYAKISDETFSFLIRDMKLPCKTIASQETFDYLFVKTPIDTLYKLPFIVVQFKENGRLTQKQVSEFIKYNYQLDVATYYLWQIKKDQIKVIIPTRYGIINILFRSTEAQFAEEKESFKKFVNSIFIPNDVMYKTNVIRDIPLINDIFYEGKYWDTIIGILMLITFFFTNKIRRRKRENGL